MLRLWKPKPEGESYADRFIARYDQLFSWSLRLTDHDYQMAEDLVQDAFVQFLLSRPDLEAIENIDGYLYTMLRNAHLSRIRRVSQKPQLHLSLAEFDSAEMGLRSLDPRARLQARDELRAICRYACLRKDSSKAGSVLLLRFFHGYYPSEIAKILRGPRQTVDSWLRVARKEALLYLENPASLGFIKEDPASASPASGLPDFRLATETLEDDLLAELRIAIFRTHRGECPSDRRLRELYASAEADQSVACELLGHIVSCARRLDRVNHLLGLPLLAERYPTDTLGPDQGSKGGPGASGGAPAGGRQLMRRGMRRFQETFEHRPKELRIAVNGYFRATQKISAELSEQELNLDAGEKLSFIEIFSEQGCQLLQFNVEAPPEGAFEQQKRVQLSDGRALEASLDLSSAWPTLRVAYFDPLINGEAAGADGLEAPDAPGQTREQARETPDRQSNYRRGIRLATGLWRQVYNPATWLRPGTVTVLLAITLAVALLLVHIPAPISSAAELLDRSSRSEEAMASHPDLVLRRTINLEERRGASGTPVAKRRIEVWQTGASGNLRASRVYDEKNNIVAGEWRKADGSVRIYRRGAKLQPSPDRGIGDLLEAGDVWRLVPAAKSFTVLIGEINRAVLEEKDAAYVVTAGREALSGGAAGAVLIGASLVVNKSDLRAVGQTLLVLIDNPQSQSPNPQSAGRQLREYHFTEMSFEQRSASAVAPAVFEPDPELLGVAAETGANGAAVSAASRALPPLAVATAQLEVEVLSFLNQAAALGGDQVSLARTPEGRLRVSGVVDSESRRTEILRALAPVATNPAVEIEVLTGVEAVERQRQGTDTPPPVTGTLKTGTAMPASNLIPVDAELRRYLSGRGVPADQLDAEIRQFSRQVMSLSRQVRRRALALKQVVERLSPADLESLDPQARAKWQAMVAENARSIVEESGRLRREMQAVFPGFGDSASEDLGSEGALVQAAQRIFESASEVDDAVRRSFSLSVEMAGAAPVRSQAFWRSLKSAERLAEFIAARL